MIKKSIILSVYIIATVFYLSFMLSSNLIWESLMYLTISITLLSIVICLVIYWIKQYIKDFKKSIVERIIREVKDDLLNEYKHD